MERLYGTLLYSLILFVLYIVLAASAFGTIIIPTFFNDKMMKPQNNYIKGLSFRKRWDRLSSIGKAFIWCVIVSGTTGFVLSTLDKWESERETERRISEVMGAQLKASRDSSRIEARWHDSIALIKDIIQQQRDSLRNFENRQQVQTVQDTVKSVKSLLSAKSFQFDTLSMRLQQEHKENITLQNEINSPVLIFNYTDNNPYVYYDTIRRSLTYKVTVINDGKGLADSVSRHYSIIGHNGNSLYVIKDYNGGYMETFKKQKQGEPVTWMSWLGDTTQMKLEGQKYLAIQYSYRNILGNKRKPLRIIFPVDAKYINKPVPLLSDWDYSVISEYLFKMKVWDRY